MFQDTLILDYAIVDIETTGGFASSHGITEIAIVVHDGKQILDTYQTLVNPGYFIPSFIQSLTGISNEMVENAPPFEDVADEIFEILKDKIFVAHNVNFDYSFVKYHLQQAGYELNSKKLCTMRLARYVYPGLPRYGLGKLCRHFEIENTARHRAYGDAYSTAVLFDKMLHESDPNLVEDFLSKTYKEQALPPNLPREQYDALPARPGVYYFYNEKGKVIYVGKAKSLKSRVSSHFKNNSAAKQKQNFLRNIYSLSFEVCATELMAIILESSEIKKLWPEFNRSQKSYEPVFGIYDYEDQSGYLHLSVDKLKKNVQPLQIFHNLKEAHNMLWKIANDFQLCPKKCAVQELRHECLRLEQNDCFCSEQKESPEEHNKRMQEAIEFMQSLNENYIIVDKGREANEKSCILVEKGKFTAMGYLPLNIAMHDMDEIKTYLTLKHTNSFINHTLKNYCERYPYKVLKF